RDLGEETTTRRKDPSLAIYGRGAAIARGRGGLIADTKVELGTHADGLRPLAAAVLTPDSSRVREASGSGPGRAHGPADEPVGPGTKVESGAAAAGVLPLADEVLTPDCSRFWKASEYEPGRARWSYDKQFGRDWSATLTDWDRSSPGRESPDDVVRETRARYV